MTIKRLSALAALILPVLLLGPVYAGQAQTNVRVGLLKGIGHPTNLTISCTSYFEVIDAASNSTVATVDDQGITFVAGGKGIEINPECTAPEAARSAKTNPSSTDEAAADFGSDLPPADGASIDESAGSQHCQTLAGPLRLVAKEENAIFTIGSSGRQGRRYRGLLEISGGYSLSVVDELSLEDYVRGVIPIEVPKSFQPEAQKALVVAIRTYVLRCMRAGHHTAAGFNVCDSSDCQGFGGAGKDAPWIDKLIDETCGQVIVYNNDLIYATYSTDCGGVTRSNEDAGFGKQPWPYLRSLVDNPSPQSAPVQPAVQQQGSPGDARVVEAVQGAPEIGSQGDYCSGDPYHTWTKVLSPGDIDRVVSKLRTAKIGKFQSMIFSEYDSSGRVKTVKIKGDAGETSLTGNRFRELLGNDSLKSTRMVLSSSPDGGYEIQGTGYGHGVGLCAFGANGMAKTIPGISYIDIIKRYYAGVEVKALNGDLISRNSHSTKTSDTLPGQGATRKSPRNVDGPHRPGTPEPSNPYDF